MMLQRCRNAILLLMLLVVSCQIPPANVAVPTLMMLPSDTLPPSPTPGPSDTLLPTLTPSDTPIPPTATREICQLGDWWDRASAQLVEFMDIAEIAASTGRGALAPILVELRAVHRRFEDINDYPECAEPIYRNYESALAFTVEGFTEFLGQNEIFANSDFMLANARFYEASTYLPELTAALLDIRLIFPHHLWGGPSGEDAVLTVTALGFTDTPTRTPFSTSTPAPSKTASGKR